MAGKSPRELLDQLFDRELQRSSSLAPFARRVDPVLANDETEFATPGPIVDILDTFAAAVEGRLPDEELFKVLPMLGAAGAGVRGSLGAFGGRLKPSTSNVRNINKGKHVKENVDDRITQAENRTIKEQLTIADKPIDSDSIRNQLSKNDLEGMFENDFLRMHRSQLDAIEPTDPLLAAMIKREIKRSDRGKAQRIDDPLETSLPNRLLNKEAELNQQGFEMTSAGPGVFEKADFDDLNSELDPLTRIIRGGLEIVRGPDGFTTKVARRRPTQDEISGSNLRRAILDNEAFRSNPKTILEPLHTFAPRNDLQGKIAARAKRFQPPKPANER
jgi:hypothetical protein